MTERTFFSLRYAVPGYTFLLFLILTILPKYWRFLINLPDIGLIGTFLAFISILGGGAIGFLVSQLWYLFNNWILRVFLSRDIRHTLAIQYGLNRNSILKYRQLFFMNYVHRCSNEQIKIYTQRRHDLTHLIGSTLFALITGILFGIIIRINTLNWFTKMDFNDFLNNFILTFNPSNYDWFLIIFTIILIGLLSASLYHSLKELYIAIEVSIRDGMQKLQQWKAEELFPEDYFSE